MGVDSDDNGSTQFVTVTHRLSAESVQKLVELRMQLVGMKAHLVGIATLAAPADSPAETPDMKMGWQLVEDPELRLRFRMPAKPERTVDENGYVTWNVRTSEPPADYTAQILKLDEPVEEEFASFFTELNDTLSSQLSAKIINTKKSDWHGHPGRVLRLELVDSAVMVRRDVIIGNMVYVLQFVTPDTSNDMQQKYARPFLDSLDLSSSADADSAVIPPPVRPAPAESTDDDPAT